MTNKLNGIAVAIALDIMYSYEYEKEYPNIFKRIFATCWIFSHPVAYAMYLDVVCKMEEQGW